MASIVAMLLTGVALPTASQAAANPTGASILKDVSTAISKEVGVHVMLSSTSGSVATKIVADIGQSAGTETITTGVNHVIIRLDSSYSYVAGNAGGLTSIMGLTTTEQKRVGTDFISAKAGTRPYKELVPNVTMKFVSNFLPTLKGATYSTKKLKANGNYEFTWTKPATESTLKEKEVLVIAKRKQMVPLSETVTTSSGTASATFTHWGERVSVSVPPPSSVITYSKTIAS